MRARRKWLLALSLLPLLLLCACILSPEAQAHAGGIVEEAVGATSRLYDKYPLKNYNLDFWIDDGFSLDIGEKVSGGISYMIYMVTLSVWDFVRALGYFVGQLVEEAYELDFISGTIVQVSGSMQKLAGISPGTIASHGLLPAFLPIVILITGAYVAYVAVAKHQASKALRTALAFVAVAVLGMGMIAGAGRYLGMLNDFQKEFNREVLEVTGMMTQGTEEGGTEGIRDSLFSILLYEPYLLLQYGTTDTDAIGQERIDRLLATEFGSEEREQIAEAEVMELGNENMSASRAAGRLGTAFLILLLDLVIIVCVALFCAVMIFSQVLFSLYAMFLPVALVFSLFPNSMGNLFGVLERVFGCIMKKAGITVILSVVFGLSSMAYSLAEAKGFLWVAFLQIVIYVGAFMKCSELLGFMRIGTSGEEKAARRVRGRASALLHTVMLSKLLRRGRTSSGKQGQEDPSPVDHEAPGEVWEGTVCSASPAPSERKAVLRGGERASLPPPDGKRAGQERTRPEIVPENRRLEGPKPAEGMDPSGAPGRPPSSPSPSSPSSSAPAQDGQKKEGEPSGRRRQKRQYSGQYKGSHGRGGHAPKASPGSSQPVPSDRLEQDKGRDAGRPNGGEKRRKKDYADAASMPPSSPAPAPDQGMKEAGESPKASRASEKKGEPGQRPPAGRMSKEMEKPGQRLPEEQAAREPGEAEPKAPAAPASADRKKDFYERYSDIYAKPTKEAAPNVPAKDPASSRDVGYKKGGVEFAKPTKFSNFEEREYDMDVLEELLLRLPGQEG